MSDLMADAELINEFLQWKATKGRGSDASPEQFVIERAQNVAFERLERIEKAANEILDDYLGDSDELVEFAALVRAIVVGDA